MIEYIDFKIDFTKRNARVGGVTLDRVTTRNYDTAIRFRIEIIGHALDDTYDVKILSKYRKSGLSVMTALGDSLEIVDGKLIYTPKVNLITEADYVRNYLYLSKDGLGLDMAQFNYQVDVSQIGEITLDIRQAYDESYEALLAEFEQALEDYKLTLPQADSVRAEIDVILNQFGMDSQAKLNQYDDDAQQVIADNQTAFDSAESGRQNTYDQAEDNRNQASNQAVADWEQGADALLGTVEGNESARADAEATRKTAETDRVSSETTRKSNETTRISNEAARKSAEVIRLASEADRVNAENTRSEFYEGFDGRLGDLEADRVTLKNLVTNGDFSDTSSGWLARGSTSLSVVGGRLRSTAMSSGLTNFGVGQDITFNANEKYYIKVGHYKQSDLGITTPALSIRIGSVSSGILSTVFTFENTTNTQSSSRIVAPTSSGGALVFFSYLSTAGDYQEIDEVSVINLTQTFGAGNEPTKAEMDELIKITGYFDEITLTQKQLLNWQLKLMRQNRNALIALGGTII